MLHGSSSSLKLRMMMLMIIITVTIMIMRRIILTESACDVSAGILLSLTEATPEAETLRETFEFRIFPMLNPDGVINGNYRCNLAGNDLNRRYTKPSRYPNPIPKPYT